MAPPTRKTESSTVHTPTPKRDKIKMAARIEPPTRKPLGLARYRASNQPPTSKATSGSALGDSADADASEEDGAGKAASSSAPCERWTFSPSSKSTRMMLPLKV